MENQYQRSRLQICHGTITLGFFRLIIVFFQALFERGNKSDNY